MKKVFQFLIGRLVTIHCTERRTCGAKFQFLIGRLVTSSEGLFCVLF